MSKIANITLFADDTNIFFDLGSDDHSLPIMVSTELDKFNDWFASNKLSLNIDKTNYIAFNSSRTFSWNNDITMGGKILKPVLTTKFLGVHIDNRLTWSEHISTVCRKIARNTGILSKLKYFLPQHILKTLYQTLIAPHLNYCSIIWSGTHITKLNPLIVLQKKAIRHVCGAAPHDHTNPLLISINLLKVCDIFIVNLSTFSYKAWNGLLPNGFNNFLISNRNLHHHRTRNADNVHYFSINTSIGRFSLRNRASKAWNVISQATRGKLSITSFRINLTRDIITTYRQD